MYSCRSETQKPSSVLVHEPGQETALAIFDPDFWGFDPSLKNDQRTFGRWLECAQGEHQQMVSVLQQEGIEVVQVRQLLEQKLDDIRRYINHQFQSGISRWLRHGYLDKRIKNIVENAREALLESPVNGVILGLEADKEFTEQPYETKKAAIRTLRTLMPQTSLYYTQDPVISTPKGLIRAKMGMFVRRQEAEILEIALGRENYIHRMRNTAEGGDVTIYAARDEKPQMFFGIHAQSGKDIEQELTAIAGFSGVDRVVRFHTPDYFDPSQSYATGNVMHLDTLMMPISEDAVLANPHMLEQTAVRDGTAPIQNALSWVRSKFEKLIEVPDDEQQGTLGWGANVFPLGNGKILSSRHLRGTNRNLEAAECDVAAIESMTLTSGFGSHHCMTAYLK